MTDSSSFAAVRDRLRLQVFDATELGLLDLSTSPDEMPCVEFVAGELYVGMLVGADAVATVSQASAWGVPFREALDAAMAPASPLEVSAEQSSAFEITDEEQVAAVLLDPSRAAGLTVAGDLAIIPLAQSRVVVTGTDDERGFERALEVGDELLLAGARLASIHPIGNRDGLWFAFPWRERFPRLVDPISRLTREFGVRAYAEQKSALDAGNVRVLEPKLDELENGVTVTFATWLSGTAALLPVVDNVIIASKGGPIGVMGFAQFIEQAGDQVVRTEMAPIRYYVAETLRLAAS